MTEDLQRTRQALTRGLLLASRHWRRLADKVVRVHGLSEATSLPLILIGHGPGQTQAALADALGMEGPSLVRLLDQLGSQGLIMRREDQSDRRAKLLSLTEQGETVLREVEADLADLRDQVFASVSVADLEASLRVLQTVQVFSRADRNGEAAKSKAREWVRV